MLEDVNCGISWALRKIIHYGGDPDQIWLVGQSSRIRGIVGVSGVYNCYDMADHFHARGLYHSLFDRIMSIDGQPELKLLSPTYCVKILKALLGGCFGGTGVKWGRGLPQVLLLHGSEDGCALVTNAVQFKKALEEAGAQVALMLYDGQTHTSPLIENPMRGGRDKLVDDIMSFVLGEEVKTWNSTLCPALLINLAARVCPF
eukprot:jgi/Botrbrau1/20503/Bobra.145_2s0061.1